MARTISVTALLLLLVTFASALEQNRQIDVYTWPLTAAKSQLFAVVEYNSTSARTKSTGRPQITADDKLIRVGHYQAVTNKWSGIVTAGENLGEGKEQVILIHLDDAGDVYHIGLRAVDRTSALSAGAASQVTAEVVPLHPAPVIQFNKPVVLAPDGQVEGPPEKTFLQKYWWAIAIFIVLQLVMGGGSDKK